jgi:phosphatidylinositol glycan class S
MTQHALDDLNDFSAHHVRLSLVQSKDSNQSVLSDERQDTELLSWAQMKDEDIALAIKLVPDEKAASPYQELLSHSPILSIYYPPNHVPLLSSSSAPLAQFMASVLQDLFSEEQASLSYILGSGPSQNGASSIATNAQQSATQSLSSTRDNRASIRKQISPELAADLAKRTTRSLKYAPTYHITFSLFTPTSLPSSWDIESAIEQYLSPLLESLSPVSNFTIDTQVQMYAQFSQSMEQPQYDETQHAWLLREETLSGFINAAEWPLSPSIGSAPTINFILYVPDAKQAPLLIRENNGNSWLIPQWGGVAILNPASDKKDASAPDTHLSTEDLEPILLTFSHQLLSLLGIPRSPRSLPLQILTLIRLRSASLLLSAASTLGSLSRLVVALPSIAIPESVAYSVDRTISHLQNACTDLRDGRFHAAMEKARIAEHEAEKGFFEKSMVGQVYFPDEHKVAVYLPLLGPVGVPLIIAGAKEVKRALSVWRARRGIVPA